MPDSGSRRGEELEELVETLLRESQRYVVSDPERAASLVMGAGYEYYKAGMSSEANVLFRRVLQLEPGNAVAREFLGLPPNDDGTSPFLARLNPIPPSLGDNAKLPLPESSDPD